MTALYEHKTQLVGDDYHGLPTAPVVYGKKPSRTGIDWDQINADYIANGGQIDNTVWPKHGKVVVIKGNARTSSANLHTFTEAQDDEYAEPDVPAPKRAARTAKKPARKPGYRPPLKLTLEQRATIGRRYQDGESLAELAKDYGVALNTISKTLATVGVPRRTRLEAGVIRRQKRSES
ncbi:MAG TPA: helix-turn-helix domain-containing protein [Kribbella sp.]